MHDFYSILSFVLALFLTKIHVATFIIKILKINQQTLFNTNDEIIFVPWSDLQTLLSSDYHCRSIICFEENYHANLNKENIFYIKGKEIETISNGIKIEAIEDLKRNFTKKSSFIVWRALKKYHFLSFTPLRTCCRGGKNVKKGTFSVLSLPGVGVIPPCLLIHLSD